MAEVLRDWLLVAGIEAHNLEQDFANGYLFGKLLHEYNLQPHLNTFVNKGKPDAYLKNYVMLQPVLSKLGVQFDTRTAQALINKEPGLAAKVLYAIKQSLGTMDKNTQALDHTSRTMHQFGMRTSPSRGMLDSQHQKTQHSAYEAGNLQLFEDIMRKRSESPNKLMQTLHVKRFIDEGERQAAAAADAAAAEAIARAAAKAAARIEELNKLAAARADKAAKLQRDDAVHAALLKHQDDREKQELRVEMALSKLGRYRQQEQRAAAAVDASSGIDAFEMTLKRLGTGGATDSSAVAPGQGESPMATLGRIRTFAPIAAKLAESGGEYLATIKARRHEEVAGRKEREARRRRLLVDQTAARSAAEARVEADSLLEVLVRRSIEEQKLAQRLWQLRQEKAAMEANRQLREEQYAARREQDWEETLRREAELHKSLKEQHDATAQQELETWHQYQQQQAAAKVAKRTSFAMQIAWQVVQLAERVIEYRRMTAGQPVPKRDWRQWLNLFMADDTTLGSPIGMESEAAKIQEDTGTQQLLNAAELQDYLAQQGEWAPNSTGITTVATLLGSSNTAAAADGAQPSQQQQQQAQAVLGRVVAELAALTQRLQHYHQATAADADAAQQQPAEKPAAESTKEECAAAAAAAPPPPAVPTAADAVKAAGTGAHAAAATIRSMPLKLAVVGSSFAGKTTLAHAIAQEFGLKLLQPEQLVADAVAAARAWEQQHLQLQQQQEEAAAQQQTDVKQIIATVQESLPPTQAQQAPSQPAGQQAMQQQGQQEQPQPSEQTLLGQRVLQELQQGSAVSDGLVIELLLQSMLKAKQYVSLVPAPEQNAAAESKAGKGGNRAAGKTADSGKAAAGAGKAGTGGQAPAGAAAGGIMCLNSAGEFNVQLPPHLAAGTPGRGFVLDGFPATLQQAQLLEKALTGLDLAAEQALVDGASLVVPPPPDVMPQLQRPLMSGLDAVLFLECQDESIAAKRVLGRRLDPLTGRMYHLDFDPPPANMPGLSDRLILVTAADSNTSLVPHRLASYAAAAPPLSNWLARFSTLRRPLDGAAALSEVLSATGDMVNGMLKAKASAYAAVQAAEAGGRAKGSADRAVEYARIAQSHAEVAARELLAAKKAEIQATALLNPGGKTAPDPAATEVLKAQAAAKCADQLKVCRGAAADAATYADRAVTAAANASDAVERCKLALGDAAVSADAEAAANKAAADAEAALAAAIEAVKKAEAAKQLSEAYVATAEKWFAAAASDVPADAAVPQPKQLAPAAAAAAGIHTDSGPIAVATPPIAAARRSCISGSGAGNTGFVIAVEQQRPAGGAAMRLSGPSCLPASLVPLLHEEWQNLERAYIEGMSRAFRGVRETRDLALKHVAGNCCWFGTFLKRPDNKQALLMKFIEDFNAIELDMRKAKETQGELLLRCEELRDALWSICDVKHEEAEAARLKLANDGSVAEHVALLGQHLTSLAQVELDRFLATCQFLYSYCHYTKGIYHPAGADRPLCPLPAVLTNATAEPTQLATARGTAAGGQAAAAQQAAYFTSLQQRLPLLAAALKAAAAAGVATQTNALTQIDDAHKKSSAATSYAATAAANAAAAAAAAAAAQGGAASAGNRQGAGSATAKGPGGAAAGAKGATAAAAASNKLAASSEEAAATAAAAAAAATALPDPAALAAAQAELQGLLDHEVQLLQQRLNLLGSKAAVMVDELVQLRAAASSRFAEWQQKRYVAECGAVAALERVVKAAAASGQTLLHDLRLEDEFLVIDESQPLLPPPAVAPPPRPASPPAPPGLLSVVQLQQLAAALQQAGPGGLMQVADAVELMLRMASQGILPSAWQDITAAHMTSALAAFDPTYSGYLDWRELLLALAAATLPAIHTATAAQIAAQAASLVAAAGNGDECVTQQEFESVVWWFEPRPELVEAAREAVEKGIGTQPIHKDTLREVDRCQAFKQLLWEVFQEPLPTASTAAPDMAGTAAGAVPAETAAAAATAASAAAAAAGATTAASTSQQQQPAQSTSAAASAEGTIGPGQASAVCRSTALLLYLCPDRDLYAGINKAVAAVSKSASPSAAVDAAAVMQMCYPLIPLKQLAPIQRAPLTAAQIAAAVAAAASISSSVGIPGGSQQAPTVGSSKKGAQDSSAATAAQGAAAMQQQVEGAAQPAIKASQLMYGAACERIVTLLLHRYQWKDVYIAARL